MAAARTQVATATRNITVDVQSVFGLNVNTRGTFAIPCAGWETTKGTQA
jgi:hypothetical protein